MAQKILMAFDGSENAMRAVEYIAIHFPTENKITLYSVIHGSAALYEMEKEKEKDRALDEALQKAKERLLKAGFKEDDISTKVEINKKGIATQIVEEAQSGRYDMIAMGRRGLSEFKEYFLGSICQKVFHMAKDVAVLLVS